MLAANDGADEVAVVDLSRSGMLAVSGCPGVLSVNRVREEDFSFLVSVDWI